MENKNETDKNGLVALLPYFLFAQGALLSYEIVLAILKFYSPQPLFLIQLSFAVISGLLALVAGFGILLKKLWGIIAYLILCIIPILLIVIVSTYARIPVIGESWVIILNITFAVYLLFRYWKKWKNGGQNQKS